MCRGPAWKREVVPDHKFDFVDIRDFTDNSATMRLKYLWVYIIVLKSFLVYVSDIFTATTMLSTVSWSNELAKYCQGSNGCVTIPTDVTKWLFVGCILFSFVLLAYESRKTRRIILSRDISYAFTNVMANNYYSIRSYDHFCFFDHISNSAKKKDDFVFFIFFTFKDWKRLLLADGPRQVINGLTLWGFFLTKSKEKGNWYDLKKYFPDNQNLSVSALTVTTMFTVIIFIGSMLLLITAALLYVPLLCYIQGNLKEYVCHKVDKRISQIIKRKNKERLAKASELAKKEAMGDYSHLKNKKGELIAQPLPQPTLPNLSVDDDDSSSMRTRGPPPSNYTQDYYYASDAKTDEKYPSLPSYQGYGQFDTASQTTLQPSAIYEAEYEGTAHLTSSAAPVGEGFLERPGTTQPSPGLAASDPHTYYIADSQDYQGHANGMPPPTNQHQPAYGEYAGDYPGYANEMPPPSNQQQQLAYGEYANPMYAAQAPAQGQYDAYEWDQYHYNQGNERQGGRSAYV